MRELVTGKNTVGPEVIDPGGRSVEKPREVTLTLTLTLNTVCLIVNYVLVAWQIFNALRDQHAIQLW
jgi:hypothetical protein